ARSVRPRWKDPSSLRPAGNRTRGDLRSATRWSSSRPRSSAPTARSRRSRCATPRELARLALFGVVGVALVQLFYFLAIHRLAIGIALLIQYLGPLLVAIYARAFGREPARRRIWLALGCSLAGLALMVELWNGAALDGLGVAFALVSAVVFA